MGWSTCMPQVLCLRPPNNTHPTLNYRHELGQNHTQMRFQAGEMSEDRKKKNIRSVVFDRTTNTTLILRERFDLCEEKTGVMPDWCVHDGCLALRLCGAVQYIPEEGLDLLTACLHTVGGRHLQQQQHQQQLHHSIHFIPYSYPFPLLWKKISPMVLSSWRPLAGGPGISVRFVPFWNSLLSAHW